jgi:ribonuclease VapC
VIDDSRDPVASRRLDVLTAAQVVIEPVDEDQARIAREAYRDFALARGRGHPASLILATALLTRSRRSSASLS